MSKIFINKKDFSLKENLIQLPLLLKASFCYQLVERAATERNTNAEMEMESNRDRAKARARRKDRAGDKDRERVVARLGQVH